MLTTIEVRGFPLLEAVVLRIGAQQIKIAPEVAVEKILAVRRMKRDAAVKARQLEFKKVLS